MKLKKISLMLLTVLYVAAGINHFVHPAFYLRIMPPYIPGPALLVSLSGVLEVVLGLLLIPRRTRRWAAFSIALMLAAFLPVHIFMLQQACGNDHYQVSVSMAWMRLLLQPLLIIWVMGQARRNKEGNKAGQDPGA